MSITDKDYRDYTSYNDYVVRNGVSKSIDTALDYLFNVDTELDLASKYIEIMLNDINSSNYMDGNTERIEYWKLGYKILKNNWDF